MRYGKHLVELNYNPQALGLEVLKSDDFFDMKSGLADNHRVIFALEAIGTKHGGLRRPELLNHLRWMIDTRTNPQTINLVLRPLNRALKKSGLPELSLSTIQPGNRSDSRHGPSKGHHPERR